MRRETLRPEATGWEGGREQRLWRGLPLLWCVGQGHAWYTNGRRAVDWSANGVGEVKVLSWVLFVAAIRAASLLMGHFDRGHKSMRWQGGRELKSEAI